MQGDWMQCSSSDESQNQLLLLDLLQQSEDEEMEQLPRRGGSRPGKLPNKDRRRAMYAELLYADYWGDSPVYDSSDFRRRFRMPKALFDSIHEAVVDHDDYFLQKLD